MCKKLKLLILLLKIKSEHKKINNIRHELVRRSNIYHNGRLEVDDLIQEESKNCFKRIGKLKRQIVKQDLHV
jgi:hypothetical protein